MHFVNKPTKQFLVFLFFVLSFGLNSQTQVGSDIDGENPEDQCGSSVSISNDGQIIAIGSEENSNNGFGTGQVRVFKLSMEDWVQVGKSFEGGMDTGMGNAVSISGDGLRLAIASSEGGSSSSGLVQLFEWDGEKWMQLGSNLYGDTSFDYFGEYISLSNDGNVIAIGSGNDDASGFVRMYEFDNSEWVQLGSDIVGEAEDDRSGRVSISSDGRTVAIGSTGNDESGQDAGHARVFEFNNGNWIKKGSNILGQMPDDRFGSSISISTDGNTVAIGGQWNDGNGVESGHAIVYIWEENSWNQIGNELIGDFAGDSFGQAISLSANGKILSVGASTNDDNGSSSGHVKIFELTDEAWVQLGENIAGEERGDFSGASISLSADGSHIIIGAIFNDGNGDGSGHARVFDGFKMTSNSSFIMNSELYVYPNPASDYIVISSQEIYDIRLINDKGQVLINLDKGEFKMDISDLPAGIYFVQIRESNDFITRKIMKL